MALEKEDRQKLVEGFRIHDRDVGSPEVQVAILTERIKGLSGHLQKAPKDVHSKRGLLSMVAKRKKLLGYLRKINPERYKTLIDKLGLKK
ncbi:MAG TPA: 30S ribosomal protein S15 [Thermodesulfobacteriota bacterium]|nr:30S ribosomal protein S15 [Thermodesulfobacteriota bacterium]